MYEASHRGILIRFEIGGIAVVTRPQQMPTTNEKTCCCSEPIASARASAFELWQLGPFSEYISPQLVPLHLSSGGLARFVSSRGSYCLPIASGNLGWQLGPNRLPIASARAWHLSSGNLARSSHINKELAVGSWFWAYCFCNLVWLPGTCGVLLPQLVPGT